MAQLDAERRPWGDKMLRLAMAEGTDGPGYQIANRKHEEISKAWLAQSRLAEAARAEMTQ